DPAKEMIVRIDKNNFIVKGDTEIDELEECLNIDLNPNGRYVTVNGLLQHLLGRLPKKGSQARIDDILFTVDEMQGNKPVRISVNRSD
ncbi:transporter associated domain-containing protein, partial [Candidatus Altiarchaeota archaeon]